MSDNACFRQRSASCWPATSPCAREGFHPRRKVVGIRVEALTHKVYDYIAPVPSVKPRQELDYDPHLDPQLVWAGKKEHSSFEVPTVSLHVHERIDPSTIIERHRASASRQPC